MAPLDGIGTVPVPGNITGELGQIYQYTCMDNYTTNDTLFTVCLGESWSLDNDPPKCVDGM